MSRLDKIIVRVGSLSGVSVDSIEFAFGFLREEDELTKTTELVVERVEGKGKCSTCGKEVKLERLMLYCPECLTPTVEITEGRDFILVSMEGETDDAVEEKAASPP
jgi:hydrogenase nickel incorporation protein HypA/HybF